MNTLIHNSRKTFCHKFSHISYMVCEYVYSEFIMMIVVLYQMWLIPETIILYALHNTIVSMG